LPVKNLFFPSGKCLQKLILPGGFFRPAKTIFAGTVFSMEKTGFSTNRQKLANPEQG
jgi:hypothetical protein